jgi:tRNA (guanine-N7-)-methyltransferase
MIAPESLAAIHVFFPDPWPKKRHHKRRLLQPGFVQLLATRLLSGGYLHIATDWQEFADWTLAILREVPTLKNTDENFAPRPVYRPLTKFERRGLRLGHLVRDIVFSKV